MSFFILCYNLIMFGAKLKELRLMEGLTQKELAKKIDCDQSMITRWEKEECEPTATAIKKIAIIFNVTSDYLLDLEDYDGRKIYDNRNFNINTQNHRGNINIK